jgi:integrase/recombinase XerD
LTTTGNIAGEESQQVTTPTRNWPLSNKILGMFRDYYRVFRPKRYLIEGQIVGEAYDARSLQQVLKAAAKKGGYR